MQQDISREITERLRVKLPGQTPPQPIKRATADAEAYQSYLKGRYYFYKYTEDGTEKAIEYFNRAIERDPNYAQAYAGLADCYFWFADVKYAPKDSMPRMKAAAQKALQLDESLAAARILLESTCWQENSQTVPSLYK